MIELSKKIFSILSTREKIFVAILIIMIMISSFLELMGIGLIMPVAALISKPELIEQNKYLKTLYFLISPGSYRNFLLIICSILIILYIVKNIFLTFQTYIQNHFILKKGASLSTSLFSNYIHAPYEFHLTHNSGHLLGNIGMADALANNILIPSMIILTESFVVIIIFLTLISLAPLSTLIIGLLIVISAFLILLPLKKANEKISKIFYIEAREMNKYALQGINAIKESKIRNVEDFFVEAYSKHRRLYNHTAANAITIGNLPRFLIEAILITIGFGSLICMTLLNVPPGSIVLLLALFAVSAVRLMPSLSRIQYNFQRIRQSLVSFDALFNDITNFPVEKKSASDDPINFTKEIRLQNIKFKYENNDRYIIDNFSLVIEKNSSVAFTGPTGCGKTTLADIILGLLKPCEGEVKVDGVNIEKNLTAWQRKIGYVPQFIFLLDDTVRANVAFGVPNKQINDQRVVECLKMAQIYEFIESTQHGINTIIGENGVRLSGGQRQRIGIARALYHNPEVLVLDEATSALDNETEKAFIDALNTLKGKLTIIMIAHRFTTVEKCDKIVDFKILNNH